MNFLQIVQRAKLESARSGGDIGSVLTAAADDKRLVNWVADVFRSLQQRPHGWSWMRKELAAGAILAGQRGYTAAQLDATITSFGRWLPATTDGYKPVVTLASGQKTYPSFMAWEDFRLAFEVGPATVPADPQRWSVAPDGRLFVGPTPLANCTIALSYYRGVQELALDADVPDMPTDFHMMLVWGALMELASFDAAPEVFSRASKNFDQMDSDMRAQYGPRIFFKP